MDDVVLDLFGFGLTISRIGKQLITAKRRAANAELPSYRNAETAYICGLGPSFRSINLQSLQGDIIATNRFLFADTNKACSPTYYCLFDNAFCGSDSAFTSSVISAYPNTAFVFDGKDQAAYETIPGVSECNSYFAYMWAGRCTSRKSLDFTKILPAFGNVACGATALALFCGYKRIVLLGCDFNSYAFPVRKHCYDDANVEKSITHAYELFVYSFVETIHKELQRYAIEHGVTLVNATRGSLLEAHPFDYEEMERIYV